MAVVVGRGGKVRLHVLDVKLVKALLFVAEEVVVEVVEGMGTVLEGVPPVLRPALALALASERRVHVRVAHDVAGATGRNLGKQ